MAAGWWIGTAALALAACGPPPDPLAPGFPVPPPPPPDSAAPHPMSSRAMPAPVLGRFAQPTAPDAPSRTMLTEPPHALPGPKPDQLPISRESQPAPSSPQPTDTLPDEVVVRILENGRAAFVRCFKIAIVDDPDELSFKVQLHVELDDNGAITVARTNASSAALDRCLVRTATWLKFPASGKPIAVELPLFYRGE